MQFVDEEDDATYPAHLRQDVLDPLLKLAPVLGARHHGGQVQGKQTLGAQLVGHIPGHHPAGQPLGHGGLAHAGFADEGGIVLLAAGEDLDDPVDLPVPAHHRVQHAPGGQPGEIAGELVQQLCVAAVLPLPGLAAAPEGGGRCLAPMAATTSAWSRRGSTPVPESTRTATPSPSRRIPSSRCSVPT